ncbi:hypothetical protein ACET3X_009476 [Alternaria dauci]|uniref:Uncharacterized protein n=1 Tax=Alternaria dauci TaxID=48095 RepID=A0ABR3U9G7_9PLEO
MRNSTDTARSGFGAFVTRRSNPEGAVPVGARRFRVRINAVAVAKGLWNRVFKSEKRTKAAGQSVSGIFPSVDSALGVRTQVMNPISEPTREVDTVAEDWDSSLCPGSFPSDETLRSLVVSSSDVLSAEDAAMAPLPLQFAEEIRQLEEKPSSPIVLDVRPCAESGLSPETTSCPVTANVNTIQHSLSLFPSAPTNSDNWIPAPDDARRWPNAPATGSRPQSEVTFKPYTDIELLVNSIERFRFTTLVESAIIDDVKDMRTAVNMTSANLLNIGWDMKRLLVIWSRITLDAPDADVLRILQPWVRLPREAVAKACGLMQKGLRTYQDWQTISDHSLITAEKHHRISDAWWAMHHKKFRELDVVNSVDFDDVFVQVELVMEECLGFEKEVAVMRKPAPAPAPARRERMTNATPSSSAGSAVDMTSPTRSSCTSASSSAYQRPIPASPTKDWSSTARGTSNASNSSSLPRPALREPKLQQPSAPSLSSSDPSPPKAPIKDGPRYAKSQRVSKPIPAASAPSPPDSPKSPTKDGKGSKEAAANVPNYLRPKKASSRASEPTETLPGYMRPTKATRGAYTPPAKPAAKATPAPRSSRLDFAIRGEQAKRSPPKASARLVEIKTPPSPLESAPPVPPKSTKRTTPNDLPKPDVIKRSTSNSKPHVFRGTAPRGPSPLWNSSPPIYTSTKVPLKVGGSDPPRFLPTNDKGDMHGAYEEEKPAEEALPRVESGVVADVEIAPVRELDLNETAKRIDTLRARMLQVKVKLQAMGAETTNTVSKVEARTKIDVVREQPMLAVDEQMRRDSLPFGSTSEEVEAREDVDQPLIAVDEQSQPEQSKAKKDDAIEPPMRIIGQWEPEFDYTDDDDDDDDDDDEDEDQDVWYDASEVSVQDECP